MGIEVGWGEMGKDDNEFMDLPDNIKLDKDEHVLCEFELVNTIHKEVRMFLCTLLLFLYANSKNFDIGVFWLAMLISCMVLFFIFLFQSIKTNKAKKLYITNRHFITHSGHRTDIGDIYFRYFDSGYSWMSFKVELCFYENKKFLFYCVTDEQSNEYINLIKTIHDISKNDRFLQEHLGYYVKQKLIKQ